MTLHEEKLFEGEDFTEKDFSNANLISCVFKRCNLSLIKLEKTRLQDVIFLDCKLMGVDFTVVDPIFLKINFEKCLIHSCNFTEMPLKGTKFLKCLIKDTYFIQANLEESNFSKSDLSKSLFHRTNLKKADFKEAISYNIDPLNNQLKGARFSKPEVLGLLEHLGIILE